MNNNNEYSSEQVRIYLDRTTVDYINRYAELKGWGRSRAVDDLCNRGIDTVFVRDNAD